MVVEAIEELAEGDKKGLSVVAIKSFILDHYKVRPDMVKHMLKTAFEKGLKDKKIARPSSQNEKGSVSILIRGKFLKFSG